LQTAKAVATGSLACERLVEVRAGLGLEAEDTVGGRDGAHRSIIWEESDYAIECSFTRYVPLVYSFKLLVLLDHLEKSSILRADEQAAKA
jgi:hypothetical protein